MRLAFVSALAWAALSANAQAAPAPQEVTVVIDATDAPRLGARASAAVRGALEQDPRFAVKAIDLGVASGPDALADADATLRQAEERFTQMDLDPAKVAVERAITSYEREIVSLASRDRGTAPLRDAHVLLAKIRFFESNPEGAKEALRRAFTIDPNLVYSSTLFPSQMKRVVVEARLLFDTIQSGKVEVGSEPAGALISLNGKPTGVRTPAVLQAAAGPNMVTVELPGYAPMQRSADVGASSGDPKLAFKLERLAESTARAREATAALQRGDVSRIDLPALASSLSASTLALVHVASPAAGKVHLTGAVYAPGKGKRQATLEARTERDADESAVEREAEGLARTLADAIHAERTSPPTVSKSEEGSSFRKSKAFWWVVGGVVGAVVVGAAVGVGVGVGLSEQHREAGQNVVLLGGN